MWSIAPAMDYGERSTKEARRVADVHEDLLEHDAPHQISFRATPNARVQIDPRSRESLSLMFKMRATNTRWRIIRLGSRLESHAILACNLWHARNRRSSLDSKRRFCEVRFHCELQLLVICKHEVVDHAHPTHLMNCLLVIARVIRLRDVFSMSRFDVREDLLEHGAPQRFVQIHHLGSLVAWFSRYASNQHSSAHQVGIERGWRSSLDSKRRFCGVRFHCELQLLVICKHEAVHAHPIAPYECSLVIARVIRLRDVFCMSRFDVDRCHSPRRQHWESSFLICGLLQQRKGAVWMQLGSFCVT